jgi:hypothetical protein
MSVGGGVFEGSLLLAVLRKSIRAREISGVTIAWRRNMCFCQLKLGVVERLNIRLPLAIGGTAVPASEVMFIPFWLEEELV